MDYKILYIIYIIYKLSTLHYLAAHEVDNNYFWWSGSVCVSVLSTVISYSLSNVENITFVQFRIYDISISGCTDHTNIMMHTRTS